MFSIHCKEKHQILTPILAAGMWWSMALRGIHIYDVSSTRIKVVEWNQAPNGAYFAKKGNDTKAFEGNVPQSILDSLGLN